MTAPKSYPVKRPSSLVIAASVLALLLAMTATDSRLAMSRGTGATLVLKSAAPSDQELLYDLLKVVRKLNAKLDELAAEDKAAQDGAAAAETRDG